MARIVNSARELFAQNGFPGTTLRAVALRAEVDPRLVAYYFGDKPSLLEDCLVPPPGYLDRINAVVHGPMRGRGQAMVANMLEFWENPETANVLRAIILTAVHDNHARERLTAIYRNNMVAAVADGLPNDQRYVRANLAASTMIGLCMTRYIYRLEPVASLPPADVVTLVGPTVQRYLNGTLPDLPQTPAPRRRKPAAH